MTFSGTVNGRSLAPLGIYETLEVIRYLPYQLVQDFFHQQYDWLLQMFSGSTKHASSFPLQVMDLQLSSKATEQWERSILCCQGDFFRLVCHKTEIDSRYSTILWYVLMIVSVFVLYICISMLYVFVFMLHLIDHLIKVCLHNFSVRAKTTSRNRHFADAKTPVIIGEVSRFSLAQSGGG